MAKGLTLNSIILGAVALGVFLLILSAVVLPQFSTSYRFAQKLCWTNATANCDYSTTLNTTTIASGDACSASVYTTGEATGGLCQAVATAGGYRTASQGLMLLILAVAVIGTALIFLKKK